MIKNVLHRYEGKIDKTRKKGREMLFEKLNSIG